MNDISTRNNRTRLSRNGLRAVGLLAIAGVLTIAARSQADGAICPWAAQGGPNPVIAVLDQGSADCWTGSSWETGTSWALGSISTTSGVGRSVSAYAFWGLEHTPPPWMGAADSPHAVARAYDSNNGYKCVAFDYTGDGAWVSNTSSDCNSAVYVVVTAEANPVR